MTEEIIVSAAPGETRIARVRDGILTNLIFDRKLTETGDALRLKDIILGRVVEISKPSQAAFVSLPFGETGLLPVRDARGPDSKKDAPIEALLREGDSVLVQVSRLPGHGKGPKITANLTLPGRFVALSPRKGKIEISKRIEAPERRTALMNVCSATPGVCGLMVRTAARDAADELIRMELIKLAAEWRDIEAEVNDAVPPALLWRDSDPVARIARDWITPKTKVIHTDAPNVKDRLVRILKSYGLSETVRIDLIRERSNAFRLYDLEDQVAALASPRVPLSPSGWITIERTEALTAIDVNAGDTKTMSAESARLSVNLAAAREIIRQIPLRDIGGLIVIDFLDLAQSDNRDKVLTALRRGFAGDGAPLKLGAFSEFGTVELSRQRTGPDLSQTLGADCTACDGTGWQPSIETLALGLLREIARHGGAMALGTVHVSQPLFDWLAAHSGDVETALTAQGIALPSLTCESDWPADRYDVRPARGS